VASGFPRCGPALDCHDTVEPAVAGSRVTLTADVHTRDAWTLAGPMLRAAIRRTDTGQLDALGGRCPPAEVTDRSDGYRPLPW
jgi:hypothetical protein